MITKLYPSALRLVIALAATAVAHGYALYDPVISWTPGTITMQVKWGSTKVLMDGTNYTSSAQAAMQSWNAQVGTVMFVGDATALARHAETIDALVRAVRPQLRSRRTKRVHWFFPEG